MVKQAVVHPHHRVLLGYKNERKDQGIMLTEKTQFQMVIYWMISLTQHFWNDKIFFILLKYSWFTVLIFAIQQTDSVIHVYIHTHIFSYSFPLWFITWSWMQLLMLYSRILLFIHSIHNSLQLLIPNLSPSFARSRPLGKHKSALCLWVCCTDKSICVIF